MEVDPVWLAKGLAVLGQSHVSPLAVSQRNESRAEERKEGVLERPDEEQAIPFFLLLKGEPAGNRGARGPSRKPSP